MRLIDADELKVDYVVPSTSTNTSCYRYVSKEQIDNAPTIDPVKHGKWGLHEYPDGYYHTECSECGAVYDEMVYFSKKANYCPNCGAKVDQEGGRN